MFTFTLPKPPAPKALVLPLCEPVAARRTKCGTIKVLVRVSSDTVLCINEHGGMTYAPVGVAGEAYEPIPHAGLEVSFKVAAAS